MKRTLSHMLLTVCFLFALLLPQAGVAAKKEVDSQHLPTMPDLEKLHFSETPSGLKYAIQKRGDDLFTPGHGQTVKVHYSGWFPDGRLFDSSLIKGEPLKFALGHGRVVKGWDEGIAMMGKGAKWVFVLPADLAYGKHGKPGGDHPIPPNATLVFQIELLDIE